MNYRAPGAYARFVPSASAVSNPGSTRVMGLVGTGLTYYEVYNETITRASDRPYDTLANSNVFEILSITDKPIYFNKTTSDVTYYEQSNVFNLQDGKHIAWSTIDTTINEPKIIVNNPNGSAKFRDFITCTVDPTYNYLVDDGSYTIEVTYVDEIAGCYRIIDNATDNVIGEYAVDEHTPRINVIPGCSLTVKSTFSPTDDSTADNHESIISVGDYVVIETTAARTEVKASATFGTAVTSPSTGLQNCIQGMTIINDGNVIDATFDVTLVNAANKTFTITKNITNADKTVTSTIIYPTSGTGTAVIGIANDFFDIIPGVDFLLEGLNYTTPADGDTVRIVTTARVKSESVPGISDIYYVNYKYKKAEADYGPKIFFDYDDIVAEYGNYDVTASSLVINSLSLGAEIAFTNGVNQIICVQAKNNSDYEMINAINQLQRLLPGVDNVNTVIPLSTSAYVGAAAQKHVDFMSEYGQSKERMTYLGSFIGQKLTKSPTALDRSLGMIETTIGYADERVVFVTCADGSIVKDIKNINTGKINERTLPACYPAIAVAALGLVNDPAEPLTGKKIAGFKYLPTTLMESEKNLLASNGCLVLEQKGTNIQVRHGLTTSQTGAVNNQEITLIQIKDYVIDAIRKACSNTYIGQKNRPSILTDIQYTVTSILSQFTSAEIILGFQGLSVKKDADNPTQIDVKFSIAAVYPLNYIDISFGFNTTN